MTRTMPPEQRGGHAMAIRNKLSDALKLTVKLLSALQDLKLKINSPTPPPPSPNKCTTLVHHQLWSRLFPTLATRGQYCHIEKKGEGALAGIWSRLKGCTCLSEGFFIPVKTILLKKKKQCYVAKQHFSRTAHGIVSPSLLKRRDPEIRLSRAITQTAELKFSLIALVLLSALII